MQDPHVMHVHPFMFPLNRDSEVQKIHWWRDGAAEGNVLWALCEMGGHRREPDLFNVRDTPWPASMLSDCAHCNLLVLATRPNLSDGERRKSIPRSGGPIENAILNRLLAYFCYLDRSRVILTREMAGLLERRHLTDIEFDHYRRPAKLFRDLFTETADRRPATKVPSSKATFGYVVRDQLWTGGPEILSFFGIDGEATIAFAHLLRTRHANLLRGRGLSVVKLKGMIPPNATSLAFVDGWESTPALEHAATTIPPPSTRELACREAPRFGPDFADAIEGRYGIGPMLSLES